MKNGLQYTVCCQLTLAQLEAGQVVGSRQVKQLVSSPTAELHELFTDLYERFRGPHLLGLQITSIRFQQPSPVRERVIAELQECWPH